MATEKRFCYYISNRVFEGWVYHKDYEPIIIFVKNGLLGNWTLKTLDKMLEDIENNKNKKARETGLTL